MNDKARRDYGTLMQDAADEADESRGQYIGQVLNGFATALETLPNSTLRALAGRAEDVAEQPVLLGRLFSSSQSEPAQLGGTQPSNNNASSSDNQPSSPEEWLDQGEKLFPYASELVAFGRRQLGGDLSKTVRLNKDGDVVDLDRAEQARERAVAERTAALDDLDEVSEKANQLEADKRRLEQQVTDLETKLGSTPSQQDVDAVKSYYLKLGTVVHNLGARLGVTFGRDAEIDDVEQQISSRVNELMDAAGEQPADPQTANKGWLRRQRDRLNDALKPTGDE